MARRISICLFKKDLEEKLKDSVFITGYQGFGLVGYLASKHIVKELELKKIGFIKTKYLPEITSYDEKLSLIYPFEIYFGEINHKKITVLLNHSLPHSSERTLYAEALAKWLREHRISKAILIGGLDSSLKENEDEKYRWIPLNGYRPDLDAAILINKYVVGPLALTMVFLDIYNISGIVVLPFSETYRPDPRASAIAVDVVSKIIGIEINTDKLLEEASIIEAIEAEKQKIMKMLEGEVKPETRGYSMHV